MREVRWWFGGALLGLMFVAVGCEDAANERNVRAAWNSLADEFATLREGPGDNLAVQRFVNEWSKIDVSGCPPDFQVAWVEARGAYNALGAAELGAEELIRAAGQARLQMEKLQILAAKYVPEFAGQSPPAANKLRENLEQLNAPKENAGG